MWVCGAYRWKVYLWEYRCRLVSNHFWSEPRISFYCTLPMQHWSPPPKKHRRCPRCVCPVPISYLFVKHGVSTTSLSCILNTTYCSLGYDESPLLQKITELWPEEMARDSRGQKFKSTRAAILEIWHLDHFTDQLAAPCSQLPGWVFNARVANLTLAWTCSAKPRTQSLVQTTRSSFYHWAIQFC